jgi:hypothetical protein
MRQASPLRAGGADRCPDSPRARYRFTPKPSAPCAWSCVVRPAPRARVRRSPRDTWRHAFAVRRSRRENARPSANVSRQPEVGDRETQSWRQASRLRVGGADRCPDSRWRALAQGPRAPVLGAALRGRCLAPASAALRETPDATPSLSASRDSVPTSGTSTPSRRRDRWADSRRRALVSQRKQTRPVLGLR